MSRYIVSNGVGMSTSDKVFDLVWNSFGNKELFDSDKSSSFEERHENSFIKGKACQIPNGGGKMDTRSENKMMSIQDCMTLTRSVQWSLLQSTFYCLLTSSEKGQQCVALDLVLSPVVSSCPCLGLDLEIHVVHSLCHLRLGCQSAHAKQCKTMQNNAKQLIQKDSKRKYSSKQLCDATNEAQICIHDVRDPNPQAKPIQTNGSKAQDSMSQAYLLEVFRSKCPSRLLSAAFFSFFSTSLVP